jgi:hypothetical protein
MSEFLLAAVVVLVIGLALLALSTGEVGTLE